MKNKKLQEFVYQMLRESSEQARLYIKIETANRNSEDMFDAEHSFTMRANAQRQFSDAVRLAEKLSIDIRPILNEPDFVNALDLPRSHFSKF